MAAIEAENIRYSYQFAENCTVALDGLSMEIDEGEFVMIEITSKKFNDPRIHLLNSDMETVSLSSAFDCCMIYNCISSF